MEKKNRHFATFRSTSEKLVPLTFLHWLIFYRTLKNMPNSQFVTMKTSLTGGYTIKQAVKSQSSFKFLIRLVDSVVKTSLPMVNCPNLWSLSMIANNTISALCSRRPNEPGLLPNLGTHRDCIG